MVLLCYNWKQGCDHMKNKVIIIFLLVLLLVSAKIEPTNDVIDTLAGATNPTFNPTIDDLAGVSEEEDD